MKHKPLFIAILLALCTAVPSIVAEDVGVSRANGAVTVFTGGVDTALAPPPPEIRYAGAAALYDYDTETLLYGYNHDVTWAPASLTKLVTIYTALAAVETGEFDLSVPRPVHPEAWFTAMAPGSSLMFLGPDQIVDGEDLIRGLLISSGNDAATEVAYRVAGSVSRFARTMNAVSIAAGFPDFYFEEPAGLSPANRITAGEFARFAAMLIREWPPIVTEYADAQSFTYPQAVHYRDGIVRGDSIRQFNRNTLITEYPGADGLKTGFIEESGYNIAATAERDGRRLIAVVLGVPAGSHAVGGQLRAEEAARLLDWGFEHYRRVAFPAVHLDELVVWGGDTDTVALSVAPLPERVLPAGVVGDITRQIDLVTEIWAPVPAGTEVGRVTYTAGESVVSSAAIRVPRNVEAGGVVTRVVDRVRWWLR